MAQSSLFALVACVLVVSDLRADEASGPVPPIPALATDDLKLGTGTVDVIYDVDNAGQCFFRLTSMPDEVVWFQINPSTPAGARFRDQVDRAAAGKLHVGAYSDVSGMVKAFFVHSLGRTSGKSRFANLDIKKIRRLAAKRSDSAVTTEVGWTCFSGAFDLTVGASTGLFLSENHQGPFPGLTRHFQNQPLSLLMAGYTDPRTGYSGDVYETALPDGTPRYFMFVPNDPESSTGRTIVFYDKLGEVSHFSNAMAAEKQ